MGNNQLETFWTTIDLLAVVGRVCDSMTISFAVAGLHETAEVRRYNCADVSALLSASGNGGKSLLVLESRETLHAREVPQRRGGVRYAVDQLSNPKSVVVLPGRLIGSHMLLSGQVGAVSKDPASLILFSAFENGVRERFVKIKSYWVGPEALQLLDGGGRLAHTAKAPPIYDLKR